MTSRLLIDNWTLQNAGQFLSGELNEGTTQEIVVSPDHQSFRYGEVRCDVVALECLCQVLNNVVFADQLFVDSAFATAWQEYSPLAVLVDEHILRPKPLKDVEPSWLPVREVMEEQLTFCPAIREQHELNKRSYAATGQVVDPTLSQVLWGGAGTLARASYLRIPYVPHPLRQRLFKHAQVLRKPPDAGALLTSIVDTQRSKLFARIDESGFLAEIQLPPAVVEIVDASSSLSDLIPAALKLRTAYRELRKWVGELQSALEEEDVQAIIARRKLLQSVSRHIDQLSSQTTTTWDVSIRIGLSWPNIAVNVGRHLNAVHNKIGIRAQINRLIITPPGRRALTKLSKLLGHGDSDALLNAFRSTQLQM